MDGIDEASKYRYPSPLKVMKDIVQQSVKMAILDPPEQADDEAGARGSPQKNHSTNSLFRLDN